MEHLNWSPAEKRIARAVFERALDAELAELLAEFKRRVAALERPEEMWPLATWLTRKQRDVNEKYDYRYSQLTLVFARLVREGRVTEDELRDLRDDKIEEMRRFLSL